MTPPSFIMQTQMDEASKPLPDYVTKTIRERPPLPDSCSSQLRERREKGSDSGKLTTRGVGISAFVQ